MSVRERVCERERSFDAGSCAWCACHVERERERERVREWERQRVKERERDLLPRNLVHGAHAVKRGREGERASEKVSE